MADQARKSAEFDHAAMHVRVAEQLADYARNGMPSEPKAPETPKTTAWRPGMRSRL